MNIFGVILVVFTINFHSATSNRPITHEDIRDAILSMAHLFRDTTDKLERHELRERQLGDQLKKALSSLDKRERTQDNLLNTIATKLNSIDDRLRNIESAVQQDDAAKGAYTVDTVPIQPWMTNVEGILNKQTQSNEMSLLSKDKLESMEAAYNSKMDYLASLIEKLQSEMLTTSAKMATLFEQQREHHSIDHRKWHSSIMSQIELQNNKLGGYNEVNNINNSITEDIRSAKDDIITLVNAGMNKMESKLKELDYSLHLEDENVIEVVAKGRDLMEDYFRQLGEKFSSITTDVNILEKIEKILIQTDVNILDTQRKTEFMMFQIIKNVEDSISLQSKDMNETINDRFNTLTDLIMDNQNVSIGNMSGKVEAEIGQVWRQIGILYTQLTLSSSLLNDLLNQTQVYANQSNNKMDTLNNVITSINTHVNEIHENENYFMGRLSLVTQEFNHTRNALATLVDVLKIDLDKPKDGDNKDLGPGPIPIDSNHDPSVDNKLGGW